MINNIFTIIIILKVFMIISNLAVKVKLQTYPTKVA